MLLLRVSCLAALASVVTASPETNGHLNGPPAPSPLNPELPPNRWGAFTKKPDHLAQYSFLSGVGLGCHWKNVEVVEGQFNFSSCEEQVKIAIAHNRFVAMNPQTGNHAPVDWLAKNGVPTVKICMHKTIGESGCKSGDIEEFPYYFAPNYYKYWKRFHQALHDWIKGLPKTKQGYNPIQSVQASMGDTGDLTPWHGAAAKGKDGKYDIDHKGKEWLNFWVNGSATMVDIYKDLLPDTKLLFNGMPMNRTDWPEYHDLAFAVLKPPHFRLKFGFTGHQYMISGELDSYHTQGNVTRTPYVNEVTGDIEFVRSRGESSDGSDNDGKQGTSFWMHPTWNSFGMACWDITFGLDEWDANPQIYNGVKYNNFSTIIWRSFQHFHTHAGAKDVASAPGAWIQLRDALDYSDTGRFPEKDFGPAERSNKDRLEKIVAKFASLGAAVDDPEAAMGGQSDCRNRKGLTQIGWRIWPTNYGKWMKQIDPMSTSVGRWRLGTSESNLLGQNCRQTVPGKNISFGFSAGLFAKQEANVGRTAVYIRVAFYDEGHGSWELHYRTPGGKFQMAVHVKKTNSKEFVESRVKLLDFACCKGEDVPTLILVDSDAQFSATEKSWTSQDPDTFAFVEAMPSPFLYQMAEKVIDHDTELPVVV